MRILMLSSTFPYPPSRGGTEIRTFNLLKHLQHRHEVTLVAQTQDNVSEEQIAALRENVAELVLFPAPTHDEPGPVSKVQRFVHSLVQGTPPNVLHRYSTQIQAWIDDYVRAGRCDVVTSEHGVNAIYVRPDYQATVATILNAHSLSYGWTINHLKMKASEHPWRDRLYLPTLYRYEKRFSQQFSRVVVTTDEDQKQLLHFDPNLETAVIPNGVDLALFPSRSTDPGGHRLVFVGAMDASHNIDAALFFAREVMPQLRQRYPDVTFSVVGTRPTPTVLALNDQPGVTVTGRVPSTVDYLHSATVCVVPLRTGFGIKNKTLEAMAAGVPVVGSDRGLEGLRVDGVNTPLVALRANQVEEYVEAISHLFDNSHLRATLAENGRSLVENTYTWEKAGQAYERVLIEAAAVHSPSARR